ncbi:unnamed protein product [Paramecium primaurelia]|uniref:GOLD domain-containing protein n=1 Tax=Paramecium primaurelia TaxID=5886 RepID=A0A8S1LPP4_PARPR|nr:unnamed protein product [Paramecium primaurelia]
MKNLFIIGCLLQLINSVSIGVEGGSVKCFFFDGFDGQIVKVPYVVTGINEENVFVELFETILENNIEYNKTLESQEGKREGQLKHIVKGKKEIYLCFQSNDSYYKIFSFDIDISGVDKNFADKNQLDETEGSLKQVLSKMHKVYRNQHFQIDRENYHEKLMESTENQVKWCALCKIVVLMSVCLIQIYMLTNFFKDKSFGPSV